MIHNAKSKHYGFSYSLKQKFKKIYYIKGKFYIMIKKMNNKAMNNKAMKKYLKNFESMKNKKMLIYEKDIPELTKYNSSQQESILYYMNLGILPNDIFKFINPKMDTIELSFILELLLWDNSPYTMSDIIIKNIYDTQIIGYLTLAIKYGNDVSKLTLTIKDYPKMKQIMSTLLFICLGSVKSESELLDIITTNTTEEIRQIGNNIIQSENYDDIYAYDGDRENLMRLSILFQGIHHKNIGREKINKYIRKEHTDNQVEKLMIGLANINDEYVLKTISNPRIGYDDIDGIIQAYIRPLTENEKYYHIK